MTQYQINQDDLIKGLMPPTKRTNVELHWLDALSGTPMQRLNDLSFFYYDQGISVSHFNTAATYHVGDRIYGIALNGYPVLECIVNGAHGPFDATQWTRILPNNIGFEERMSSRANRMQFEWAINRYFEKQFGTSFRQPDMLDTVRSDIYIQDNALFTPTVFELGPDDFTSSFMGPYDDGPWMGLDPSSYPSGTVGAFTIYYSTLIMVSPGPYSAPEIEQFIRQFADRINYSSMPYNVTAY